MTTFIPAFGGSMRQRARPKRHVVPEARDVLIGDEVFRPFKLRKDAICPDCEGTIPHGGVGYKPMKEQCTFWGRYCRACIVKRTGFVAH